ncbi:hypothetical protein [Methylomonas sp. CM2]|uniref:hypothetical protein n=1 Tax=Methylomonas sp. CM2 TaxID=3417647 RepID=UPI003CF3E54D
MNYSMNNKQTLSYLKAEAKKLGCTLKEQTMTINGGKAYKYVIRGTDDWLIKNMTLGMALENFESGKLADLVNKNR